MVLGGCRRLLLRCDNSCVHRFAFPLSALSDGSVPERILHFFRSLFALEVAGSLGLGHIRRDLRRGRISWLYAAPDRTAARRACCDLNFLTFLHGGAPHERLGNAGNGSHSVWRRRAVGARRLVLQIAYPRHARPYADGHWIVCLLVDRYRWQLHCAANYRDRHRSTVSRRMLGVHALAFYSA